jgi:hypothetical protein
MYGNEKSSSGLNVQAAQDIARGMLERQTEMMRGGQNMVGSTLGQPVPTSEVNQHLQRLDNVIAELHRLHEALVVCLQPVLGEVGPETPKPGIPYGPLPITCSMSDRLCTHWRELDTVREKLGDVVNRVRL